MATMTRENFGELMTPVHKKYSLIVIMNYQNNIQKYLEQKK